MDNFEDEIKIAFNRIKSSELKAMLQEHEEISFDAETTAAFNRIERDRLKKKLIEHAEESIIIVPAAAASNTGSPFASYWKFAAAACVIIGIGMFLYNLNGNNKGGGMAEIKQSKNEKPKTNENTKQEKTTKDENQIFISKVFAEEIGELGFGSKPFELKVVVNKANKVLKYRFSLNTITFKSPRKISVTIYKIQDHFYFRIDRKVFLLEEGNDYKIPKEELDKEILDLIP